MVVREGRAVAENKIRRKSYRNKLSPSSSTAGLAGAGGAASVPEAGVVLRLGGLGSTKCDEKGGIVGT
jgi:hypothetical protein